MGLIITVIIWFGINRMKLKKLLKDAGVAFNKFQRNVMRNLRKSAKNYRNIIKFNIDDIFNKIIITKDNMEQMYKLYTELKNIIGKYS